jgi:endonuclease/exonuclease/phosphatase (EEP) superfamily protein YafD
VVVGDLNASMWSGAYKKMTRSSKLANARAGYGLVPTQHGHGWMSQFWWRPIDHCLHSEELVTRRFWTGPNLGSDHLPILAELEIKPSMAPAAQWLRQ